MAKNELLKLAHQTPSFRGRPPQRGDEELAPLALAWAKGEISLAQVTRALHDGESKTNTSAAYRALARGLRHVIKEGIPAS